MSFKKDLISARQKGQVSIEYFLLFVIIGGLVLSALQTGLLTKMRESGEKFFQDATQKITESEQCQDGPC